MKGSGFYDISDVIEKRWMKDWTGKGSGTGTDYQEADREARVCSQPHTHPEQFNIKFV
jgi:hypothetical protein